MDTKGQVSKDARPGPDPTPHRILFARPTVFGVYFTNYAGRSDWRMVPARLEGREGLLVLPSGNFVELTVQGDRIAQIRDFHHVPYLTAESQPVSCSPRPQPPTKSA